MKRGRARSATWLAIALLGGATPAWAGNDRPPPPSSAERATPDPARALSPALADIDGRSEPDYAQREARHPEAAQFRGGDGFGIYISSGAAVVIVVVLLILFLR